jgi:hypothetical protein
MENLHILELKLEKEIVVFRIKATTFPEGVGAAHQKLHSLVEWSPSRHYFGVSRPGEQGSIVYWAAASELVADELGGHGLEKFIIEPGIYKYLDVHLYMQNISEIGHAFKRLTMLPDIDPNGYCLEWYMGTDCRCMIKLK